MLSRDVLLNDIESVIERLNRRGKDYTYLRKFPALDRTYQKIQTEIVKFKKMRTEMDKKIGYRHIESRSNRKIAEKNKRALEQLNAYEKKAKAIEKLMDAMLKRTPNIPHPSVSVVQTTKQTMESNQPFDSVNFASQFTKVLAHNCEKQCEQSLSMSSHQDVCYKQGSIPRKILYHHDRTVGIVVITDQDYVEKHYVEIITMLSDTLIQQGIGHTIEDVDAPSLHEAASQETRLTFFDHSIRIINTGTYYARKHNITVSIEEERAKKYPHIIVVLPIDLMRLSHRVRHAKK